MKIERRSFLKSSLACGTLAGSNCSFEQDIKLGDPYKQPNIILLVTDDHRYDTLGCMGHPIVQTPNIDELADNGCLFKNAFVTTSICAASRASIFTGQYERNHQYTFGTAPLSARFNGLSYPKLLRDNGYKTGFIGKFGVQVESGFKSGNFDYYKQINRSPYIHTMENGESLHETDACTAYAKEFIKSTDQTKPFCLSISFNAPHAAESRKVERPFPPPNSSAGLYDGVKVPLPELHHPDFFDSLPSFLNKSLNRKRYFWRWESAENFQQNMRDYLAMITGIDNAIGELVRFLDSMNISDNTVLIFSADNGLYLGDRGFAGKWSHFEQALRVPLIIKNPRAPKSKRGIINEQLVLNIDLFDSILDFAGVKPIPVSPSKSLRKFTLGEEHKNWREYFLCEHLMNHIDIPKWEGIRSSRYSYARYFEQLPIYEFLYDLKLDPNQTKNLAHLAKYKKILAQHRTKCDSLIDTHKT